MKKITILTSCILLIAGCAGNIDNNYRTESTKHDSSNFNSDYVIDSYAMGYKWAEDNDIDNFDDCQNQFGTGDAEDGCNEYVKENYSGYKTFGGYECTEDCSGHKAGYDWAEDNNINDLYDCRGNSQSFIEGCIVYVRENY